MRRIIGGIVGAANYLPDLLRLLELSEPSRLDIKSVKAAAWPSHFGIIPPGNDLGRPQ